MEFSDLKFKKKKTKNENVAKKENGNQAMGKHLKQFHNINYILRLCWELENEKQ